MIARRLARYEADSSDAVQNYCEAGRVHAEADMMFQRAKQEARGRRSGWVLAALRATCAR